MRRKVHVYSLLTLVLTGALLLWSYPVLKEKDSQAYKTLYQYWRNVDLNEALVRDLINDSNCHLNPRKLLACINSVESVARAFQLALNTDGTFRPLTLQETQFKSNAQIESDRLNYWTSQLKSLSSSLSPIKAWQRLNDTLIQDQYRSFFVATAMNGYFSILYDPHSYLVPLDWYQEQVAHGVLKKRVLGFQMERTPLGLVVSHVTSGSQAEMAGLKAGDILHRIDSLNVKSLYPFEVIDRILSQPELSLRFYIKRNLGELSFDIPIESEFLPAVEGSRLKKNPSAAHLRIRKFSAGSCQLVENQLLRMKENVQGLILDLRDNPGGYIEESSCIAGLFLGKNQLVFQLKSKTGDSEYHYSKNRQLYNGKIVILVNKGTASSAEILTGALQDHGRAQILGEPTFGKGSYQSGEIWPLNPKVAFFKTEGLFFLPGGESPQLIGIQPDIPLKTDVQTTPLLRESVFWSALLPQDFNAGYIPDFKQSLDELTLFGSHVSISKGERLLSNCGISIDQEDPPLNSAAQLFACNEAWQTLKRRGAL